MIYLIHAAGTDLYKIGFARNPPSRLRELQTGCPHELRILSTTDGSETDEGRAHARLASARVRGEWFRFPSHACALAAFDGHPARWVCDRCGGHINSPQDGAAIWLYHPPFDGDYFGLEIVHHPGRGGPSCMGKWQRGECWMNLDVLRGERAWIDTQADDYLGDPLWPADYLARIRFGDPDTTIRTQ